MPPINNCDCTSCRPPDESEQVPAGPPMTCEFCGRSSALYGRMGIDPRQDRNDHIMCSSCYRSHAWCQNGEHYGAYPREYRIVGQTEAIGPMCERCFEDVGYLCCDQCDEIYPPGSSFADDYLCQSCYDSQDEYDDGDEYWDESSDYRYVRNYSYRPSLMFQRTEDNDDNYYLGLELETDCINVLYVSRSVEETQPNLFCKSDASLRSGVEIVSHPGTLAAWASGKVIDWDKWGNVSQHCPSQRNQVRAGIHIHVSRSAFERNGKWAASHLWKFMQLHYRNEVAFQEMAGRSSTMYAEWNPVSGRSVILDDTKNNGGYGERHRIINVNNQATIEMRYFQADERQEVILQRLELIHAAVEYTRSLSAKAVKEDALDFSRFRTWISGRGETYPNLKKKVNRMVADGIITRNREVTKRHDTQVKLRQDVARLRQEERVLWFRTLGLGRPRLDGQYAFSGYPSLTCEGDVENLFANESQYLRFVAGNSSTLRGFLDQILHDLTTRYARVCFREVERDTYHMIASDWLAPIGYLAAQIVIHGRRAYDLPLTDQEAERLVENMLGYC